MTVLAGLIDNVNTDRMYLAADRQVSSHHKQEILQGKIWKANHMLFGFCGEVRDYDIIRYVMEIPDHDPRVDAEKYIRNQFVEALWSTCKRLDRLVNDKPAQLDGSGLIVGYQQKFFKIHCDFSVVTSTKYAVSGSGGDMALGSLLATELLPYGPSERLEEAIKAACQTDLYCGFGIDIERMDLFEV